MWFGCRRLAGWRQQAERRGGGRVVRFGFLAATASRSRPRTAKPPRPLGERAGVRGRCYARALPSSHCTDQPPHPFGERAGVRGRCCGPAQSPCHCTSQHTLLLGKSAGERAGVRGRCQGPTQPPDHHTTQPSHRAYATTYTSEHPTAAQSSRALLPGGRAFFQEGAQALLTFRAGAQARNGLFGGLAQVGAEIAIAHFQQQVLAGLERLRAVQ